MSKINNWLVQMQEDAEHMTLNEFIAEHGEIQQVIDVWTAKQMEMIEETV